MCAKRVLNRLTDQHKEQRICSGRAFLDCYQQDIHDLFSQIVTDDETWISYAESKQSMQWHYSSSPVAPFKFIKTKNFKQSPYLSLNDGYLFYRQKGHDFG